MFTSDPKDVGALAGLFVTCGVAADQAQKIAGILVALVLFVVFCVYFYLPWFVNGVMTNTPALED